MIRKRTLALIEEWLPELFCSPFVIAEDHYQSQLNLLEEALANEFSEHKAFTTANHTLVRFINEGNKSGRWSLPVPPPVIRVRRQAPLRTARWFRNTRNLNQWTARWHQSMQQRPATSVVSSEDDALAALLVGAAIHGGLCLAEALVALANQLVKNRTPLRFQGDTFWIDLVFVSPTQDGNVKVANKITNHSGNEAKTETLRRWYPDAVSLALIQGFLAIRHGNSTELWDKHTVWQRIRRYLVRIDSKTGKNVASLNQFCRSAMGVAESAGGVDIDEALVNYAIGTIPSASLPTDFFALVLGAGKLKKPPRWNLDQIRTTSLSTRQRRSNPHGTLPELEPLIRDIREAIRPKLTNGLKNTPKQAISQLNILQQNAISDPVGILVAWLIHLLKNQKNKVSTANRYFTAIGKTWILNTIDVDLFSLDDSDFEALYQNMLDNAVTNDKRNFNAGRLMQLHQFAHQEFGLAYLEPDLFGLVSETTRFVRAGYITERLFEVFLGALSRSVFHDESVKQGLKILYLIAFRTGLRLGELLKLRLADIEPSTDRWLFVRNNRFGNNKSSSSLRKIPLKILLLPAEVDEFNNYLRDRKTLTSNRSGALLFSLSQTPHDPLNRAWVSAIASRYLREISLLPFVFHHFRHSAISRLQIVVEGDENLLAWLTPYDVRHATGIRNALGSLDQSDHQRDRYWAIAGLAGHLTPATTFASYYHFTDWILGKRMDRAKWTLTKEGVRAVSSLSIRTINTVIRKKDLQSDAIPLRCLRPVLARRLKKYAERVGTHQQNNTTGKSAAPATVQNPQKNKLTLQQWREFLVLAENGVSVPELCQQFNLSDSRVKKRIEAAKRFSEKLTSKQRSRLFPKRKNRPPIGVHLAPTLPQSRAELHDIEKAIQKLNQLYRKGRNKTGFDWCLDYTLENITASSSKLIFHDPSDFKKYMKWMLTLFPAKRWHPVWTPRVSTRSSQTAQDRQLKLWQEACSSCMIEKSNDSVRRKSAYPNGKLVLYLAHPEEEKILKGLAKKQTAIKHKRYSTRSLRYVFHLMGILMD